MAIIGIFGYAGSGKDTVGKLIQYVISGKSELPMGEMVNDYAINEWWLEELSSWEIKKWAGKLKAVASLLTGIPQEKFEDQEFKKINLGPEWGMTVRDLLQKLGTDAMRNGLHTNAWINALMADYKPGEFYPEVSAEDHAKLPNWIITDTRFPNEAQAIKDKGGIVVKIERSGVGPVNDHPSETALKDYNFDYTIENDGTLEDLLIKIKKFLNSSVFTSL